MTDEEEENIRAELAKRILNSKRVINQTDRFAERN